MKNLLLLLPLWLFISISLPCFAGVNTVSTKAQLTEGISSHSYTSRPLPAAKQITEKAHKIAQAYTKGFQKTMRTLGLLKLKWLLLAIVCLIAAVIFFFVPITGVLWLPWLLAALAVVFAIVWILKIVGIFI